jgi:hypothetical protein
MSVSLPYFNSTFHADVLEVIPELSLSKIFSYHEAELSSEESAFSPTTNLRIKVRSSLVVDGLQMKYEKPVSFSLTSRLSVHWLQTRHVSNWKATESPRVA